MYKHLLLLALLAPALLALDVFEDKLEDTEDISELAASTKTGAVTLSDSTTTSFLQNAIYVVPVLLAIIFVDFAIFGAFASRSDELNPVSDFFYHVKRGLSIVRDRSSTASVYSRPHHHKRYQLLLHYSKHKYSSVFRLL